jgi:hypothetical protein
MKCSFLSERHMLFARPKNKTYTPRSSETQEYCKSRPSRIYPLCPKSPKHEMPDARGQIIKGLHARRQAEKIAEAIILQAIEDLWSDVHRQESIEFFTGEGFAICARIAGMGLYEKLKLIQAIKKSIQKKDYIYPKQFLKQAWG